jgi:hypothetical protein
VIDAVIGTWEAHRHGSEPLSATVRRLGIDSFAATLEAVLEDRWATGPEPTDTDVAAPVTRRRPATAAVA